MTSTRGWIITLVPASGFAAPAHGAEPQPPPDYSARMLGSEIVAGYPKRVMAGVMPGKRLSRVEVEALVRYLGSLAN